VLGGYFERFSQARNANGSLGWPGTVGRKKNTNSAKALPQLRPPCGETQKSMTSDRGFEALSQIRRGEMSTGCTLSPAVAGVGGICSPSAQADWRRHSSSSHVDFLPRKGGFQPNKQCLPPSSAQLLF